ncbi:hypothetical protein AN958_08286 [Leucoagaricus sp. SymC.cos]|nr:hypothetical protein AN958_08286 [Leucoagaricus sp. SymC.cos]
MSSVSSVPPLPGFGSPLNHEPKDYTFENRPFPSALCPSMYQPDHPARLPAITLRELAMLHFMDKVTDKNEWERKVFDEPVVEKWKAELGISGDEEANNGRDESVDNRDDEKEANKTTDQGGQKLEEEGGGGVGDVEDGEVALRGEDEDENKDEDEDEDKDEDDGPGFTSKMFQYCVEELRYKAEKYKKSSFVHIYPGDVVKSDSAIPADLLTSLKSAVSPLESVPKKEQDWHPGSNEQVLDLVHPSLFPLVYGLSRILPNSTTNLNDCVSRCGEGEVLPIPLEEEAKHPPFQGQKGYAYSRKFQWLPCDVDISGDTPKIVVEKILERVIPVWNATLSPLRDEYPQRITYDYTEYDEPAWEAFREENGPKQEGDEDDDEDYLYEWESDNKWNFYIQPDVKKAFSPPPEGAPIVDLKKLYADKGLQIIVKLANIHLTPEKPHYDGGTWHIEGQLNEHICATAIYYYDCENITSSRLAFRSAVDPLHLQTEVNYAQNDNDWLGVVYGLSNWAPGVQNIGSVEAREGRLVTFPNILQHKVQPFELADPTKPGHRKILAFFLVDPNMKIISTANVPCQRRDWWGEAVVSDTRALARLPVELRDKVVHEVEEFPIDLDQARQLRENLMEERKEYVIGYQDAAFKSATISLCEH